MGEETLRPEPPEDSLWLHRRDRATWLFTPNQRYRQWVHITRKGTVYAVIPGLKHGKPFWVGRLSNGIWYTVERELRAREIEFSGGGRYLFPD